MKKRTARLAALGLSAIFIASTVSFPVHAAEVPEDSGSSLSASKNSPEDTKEAPAEEEPALEELPEEEAPALKELPEEDLPKAEDLPVAEDLPAKEELKVEDAPISLEDEAADEDSNDETPESRLSAHKPDMDPHDFDFDEAAQTIENAVQTSDDAKQNTADASSHTENVVAVVSNEQTTSDEAALAIENAQATVDEAKATFDQAETNYNDALDAYNQAVEAYNAILEEYNTEKELTAAELKEAEQALNEAMDAVDVNDTSRQRTFEEIKTYYKNKNIEEERDRVIRENRSKLFKYIYTAFCNISVYACLMAVFYPGKREEVCIQLPYRGAPA